jgi:hypothetical protein
MKARVISLKNRVLRIRICDREYAKIRKVARKKTGGNVSVLVRYFIANGLKKEMKNVLQQ